MLDVMILAAGRGERLRPLTDHTPKPLLEAGGRMLIEHHLLALSKIGVRRVIVNTAHLPDRIHERLGSGARYGLEIVYSDEPKDALETAGGIVHALPHIRSERLLVINGDVFTNYDFARLLKQSEQSAHLVLVNNPPHHPAGDFALENGHAKKPAANQPALTFSGIGVYRVDLFRKLTPGRRALAPLLFELADAGDLTAEHHAGKWTDVGTLERLNALRAELEPV